ncbi:MAG: DUF4150 domain-containing protein [Polyangiaceae bacterium]|nr:DUF4150 domain-containing protein [Polyangiaceae bacterium]
MAENEGLRVTGEAIVMSLIPDFCKTPPSMFPVPYQIIGRFNDGVRFSDTVSMTGMKVMNTDGRLPTVYGDEAGTGGGIISGVNKGWCRPITYSSTVKSNGKPIVFHTSLYWMNCAGPDGPGNTIGIARFVKDFRQVYIGPLGEICGATNPEISPETPEEKEWYESLWDDITSGAEAVADASTQLANQAWQVGGQIADGAWQFASDIGTSAQNLAADLWDQASATAGAVWNAAVEVQMKYRIIERGFAVLGIVDGAKNVVAGVLASGTLLGAAAGVPVAAYGVDTVVANAKQLWTGEFQPTYTEQLAGPYVDFAASLITPTNFLKKLAKEGLEQGLKEGAERGGKELAEKKLPSLLENGIQVSKKASKIPAWPSPKAQKLIDQIAALSKDGAGKHTQELRKLAEELGNEGAKQQLRNKLGKDIADDAFKTFNGPHVVNVVYKDPATGIVHVLEAKGGKNAPKLGDRTAKYGTNKGSQVKQGTDAYLKDVAKTMANSGIKDGRNEVGQDILKAMGEGKVEYTAVWTQHNGVDVFDPVKIDVPPPPK